MNAQEETKAETTDAAMRATGVEDFPAGPRKNNENRARCTGRTRS